MWRGFIHPLNATINALSDRRLYTLKLVVEKISVVLYMSYPNGTAVVS